MNRNLTSPFVKWAGGKRQLLEQIYTRMPKRYKNYFEPFIGGGALLFDLQPDNALINDINKSLIHAYREIQVHALKVFKELQILYIRHLELGKDFYYMMRENYNNKLVNGEYDLKMAALFIFLNKHCFNGLYRVNGKGLFNVPYNNSQAPSCNADNLVKIGKYLKRVMILEGDFETACEGAKKGDFIFFDSPYAPLNPSSFESYTKEGFDLESHQRLAALFERLTKGGCKCMLTNHNTDLICSLYGNYHMDIVPVKRFINSNADKRIGEEVIIRNYR